MADLFASERFNTLFLAAFAALALLLASIGVYGTTAYAVSRRTHEIGIRMALGARSGDVLRAVLCRALKLTSIGIALGLAGSIALTRIIRSLLYDVSPTDPLTFACVALFLAAAALFASYLPARRAAKIDPMQALRYE
jgi:ABC-type antimicrobial peptide transport system permease subunit